MAAMGWQPGQFAAYQLKSDSEPLEGLCDGSLDAAFVVAGHPSLAVGDLISRCKVRLIPIEGEQIDRLLQQHPYYQRSRIAANLYPGQTTAINNIGMSAELVALASLPDPIVRTVRDTLLARVKQFSRLHPALKQSDPRAVAGANRAAPPCGDVGSTASSLVTDSRAVNRRTADTGAVNTSTIDLGSGAHDRAGECRQRDDSHP